MIVRVTADKDFILSGANENREGGKYLSELTREEQEAQALAIAWLLCNRVHVNVCDRVEDVLRKFTEFSNSGNEQALRNLTIKMEEAAKALEVK